MAKNKSVKETKALKSKILGELLIDTPDDGVTKIKANLKRNKDEQKNNSDNK